MGHIFPCRRLTLTHSLARTVIIGVAGRPDPYLGLSCYSGSTVPLLPHYGSAIRRTRSSPLPPQIFKIYRKIMKSHSELQQQLLQLVADLSNFGTAAWITTYYYGTKSHQQGFIDDNSFLIPGPRYILPDTQSSAFRTNFPILSFMLLCPIYFHAMQWLGALFHPTSVPVSLQPHMQSTSSNFY